MAQITPLAQLHKNLVEHFDLDELRTFCFELGVDYDDLPGETKSAKARELVKFMVRQNHLAELAHRLQELRQNVNWPNVDALSPQDQQAYLEANTPLWDRLRKRPAIIYPVLALVVLLILVVLAASLFNIGGNWNSVAHLLQGTATPTPVPSPVVATELVFSPAQPNESLIVVTDFDNRSDGNYKGIDPAQYIYEQLLERAKKDKLDVRVERLRQVVDDNAVRHTRQVYSATLVLWGWYDTLAITPRIERTQSQLGYRSSIAGRYFWLTKPISTIVAVELPQQVTYTILFTLGCDSSNIDTALKYYDSALATLVTDPNVTATPVTSTIDPSAAYFNRGNIYFTFRDFDRAITDYTKAIQFDPRFVAAYNNRGIAYTRRGDVGQANADFEQITKFEPDYTGPYCFRRFGSSEGGETVIADLTDCIVK